MWISGGKNVEYLELQLPENVQKIITTLQMYGYEAYAVGGCVRDSLLNRTPGDWDITTSAMPGETKSLFDKTFDTGIERGIYRQQTSEGSNVYKKPERGFAAQRFYNQCNGIQ